MCAIKYLVLHECVCINKHICLYMNAYTCKGVLHTGSHIQSTQSQLLLVTKAQC
jgi:hypothetical protein